MTLYILCNVVAQFPAANFSFIWEHLSLHCMLFFSVAMSTIERRCSREVVFIHGLSMYCSIVCVFEFLCSLYTATVFSGSGPNLACGLLAFL